MRDKASDGMQWSWGVLGDENAHGPFATREEAIADACRVCDPGDVVEIGTVLHASSGAFVPDLDKICEQMDADAQEAEFAYYDDDIFSIAPHLRTVAESELRAWCERFVQAKKNVWAMSSDSEEFTIPRPADVVPLRSPEVRT